MNRPQSTISERTLILKDGRELRLRAAGEGDLEALRRFFQTLPEEERVYLRFDVSDEAVLEKRLHEQQDWGRIIRLLVLDGEEVVATGLLELKDVEREFDLAELRLMVAPDYRRCGLGMLLARELYFIAARERIREIRARALRPQEAALAILRRLGFHEIEVLEDAALDRYGKKQDVIVMACPLEELWKEMELLVEDFDLQHL